jgi:peptidyl-prolyl cis-trans isomerase A (cyclophilin A)
MNIRRTLLFSSLAVAAVAGAAFALFGQQATPPASQAVPNGPTVVMDTSMGRITCQFYEKQAPRAVANFIALAEGSKDWTDPATGKMQRHKRYYDGTIFHRVIPEFMIQGGDPTGTGTGNPGYIFDDEFDPGLNFDRPGRLAMANSGPNTNASQFFISEQAADFLDQHYTVFGQCDDASVTVVKAIARVERDANDKPLSPVVLKKVTIVREGEPKPPVAGEAPPPGAQPKVVNISAGVAVGLLKYKTAPVYPVGAKNTGLCPKVVLDAVIGTDGLIKDLKIVTGAEQLQQAALDAVRQWRYRPYLLNGQPVAARTTVNLIFNRLVNGPC